MVVLDKLEQYFSYSSTRMSEANTGGEATMVKQWNWYVYIIKCLDDTFYTGLTWKPELRFDQHISGLGGKYTAEHGVKKLVYLEEHNNLEQARLREKQIKNWSQKKKQKLINGKWSKEW